MQRRLILIVDDQEINRVILGKMLSQEYQVLQASNGKDALDILNANKDNISAVILDIIMPVMDGYEVLKKMNEDKDLSKIPVIVSSQDNNVESEIKALALGAQDFIAKPYDAKIILHRLHNTIKLRETAAIINKAQRDELTGLYNKTFFLEKVSDLISQRPDEKYDLICFGIEKFRLVNETYGTDVGDELLQYIGKYLLSSKDSLISSRFTADQFYSLVLHRDDYPNELIRASLEKFQLRTVELSVRLHFGIYLIDDPKIPVSAMCERAAMAAKENKSHYDSLFSYYDDDLRRTQVEQKWMTDNMLESLAKKEFVVYYQPKYDLTKEAIAGAEALVRWESPEKGLIKPDKFIPLFERTGLITTLDSYVWEVICQDLKQWLHNKDTVFPISANVSRADLFNPKLVDILTGLLKKYEIPIHILHLEITESAYTDNQQQIIQVVKKLRSLGFVIEMDDFGTGYSSLNMLAEMPVDVLKLDMGFVRCEALSSSSRGVLSFCISLAKWLNLSVIAEGVETKEQVNLLRSMDCNFIQGYYFAKPMKKNEFENLLQKIKVSDGLLKRKKTDPHKNLATSISTPKMTMLIVDDVGTNREVLSNIFREEYKIIEVNNADLAWQYLETNYAHTDMVLLALLMPNVDGFQLLRKIREDIRTAELPVIVSLQGDAATEQKALELKANDYIVKPFNAKIVYHRVKNIQDNYRLKQRHNETRELMPSAETTNEGKILAMVDELKKYFDIVRLVDPEETTVISKGENEECDNFSCFQIWGKTTRCSNCISLKAYNNRSRYTKLEYTDQALYYVISQYIPYGPKGAVMEMVTKMDPDSSDQLVNTKQLRMNLMMAEEQSNIDPLTQTYNQQYLDLHLNDYLLSAKKNNEDLAISYLKITDFEALRQTYGHLISDQLIKALGQKLKNKTALRPGDFVCHLTDDNFVIVSKNATCQAVEKEYRGLVEHSYYYEISGERRFNYKIEMKTVDIPPGANIKAYDLAKMTYNEEIGKEKAEISQI